MLKKTILAAATAAVALTFAGPGSAGSSIAEARSAQLVAQASKLKTPTKRPTPPSHIPVAPSNTLASPFIDLVGEHFNPAFQEGQPGSHYCSNEPNHHQRSRHVQIIVRNKGTNVAAPVHVAFNFAGKSLIHTIPLLKAGAVKGSAVAIPDHAWRNGKVNFTIRIDHANQIGETNENNNTYHSFCTEPN